MEVLGCYDYLNKWNNVLGYFLITAYLTENAAESSLLKQRICKLHHSFQLQKQNK